MCPRQNRYLLILHKLKIIFHFSRHDPKNSKRGAFFPKQKVPFYELLHTLPLLSYFDSHHLPELLLDDSNNNSLESPQTLKSVFRNKFSSSRFLKSGLKILCIEAVFWPLDLGKSPKVLSLWPQRPKWKWPRLSRWQGAKNRSRARRFDAGSGKHKSI